MKKQLLLFGLLLMAVVPSFGQSLPDVYEVPDSNQFRTLSSAYSAVVFDGSVWVRTAGSRTSNGGTIQTGPSGYYYARQYSGLINVRWFGAKVNDGVDDTALIQKAINTGENIYLPRGTYKTSSSLIMKNNSLVGDGPAATYLDKIGNGHAIYIPNKAYGSREAKRFSGFSIISSDTTAARDYYAFYFAPTPAGLAAGYNSGISISDVEIFGKGPIGGGIYLSDCSKIDVSHVGMTWVNNPVSLIGSVIQSTFTNVTCYFDGGVKSITLPNTGVLMDYRTNYAEGKLMGPESTKLIACSFVQYDIGVEYRFGLYAVFDKLDVDYYKQYGFLLKYESCRILNSWMSTATTSEKAVAIKLIPSGFTPGDLFIQNNQINAYNVLHSTSNAIELGDNGAGLNRFSWGGHIYGNSFTGPQGAWNYGIQADRTRGVIIRDNVMSDSLCTNNAINLIYCRHTVVSGNILQSGTIKLQAILPKSFGSITDNNANISTSNIADPGNWEIARNVSFSN